MPNRSFRTRLGAALAGVLTVPLMLTTTPAATAAPAAPPTDRELQAALDAVVAAGASGVVVRVDDGRRTSRLAAGAARLEPRLAMRPDARVRVGSITKTFAATLALQLAGERRLRLDDTVERWLPGLVPDGDGITLRQLLNHTSGIFNYTEDEAFNAALAADPLREYSARELVGIATAHPPNFPPGTSWSYSNTGYVVLGMVLERVTHRPLHVLLDQRILRPLDLDDTYLPARSPDIAGYHARGYVPPSLTGAGYVDVTRISPTAVRAAGALVSNADDLRRFYRALLGGRLLRPAQLAEMRTMVEVEPGFGYGLGLYTAETPCGRVWGHDGGVPGYVTIAWNDESGRRSVDIALPTQPDEAIGVAGDALVAAAVCRMFGRPVTPPPAAAAATTSSSPSLRFLATTIDDKWPF